MGTGESMAGSLSLREIWASFGVVRKLLWAAAVVCLPTLVVVLFWLNPAQREYRVLFAGLSDRDGGEVVKALEKLRIPYQLNEPGGAIEVPLSQLHIARYKLAVEGIPKTEHATVEQPGMRFGLSSFQEQVAHQRTLEAELAHSIKMLDRIKSARVHLALPKQSAFLREPVLPSASVLITPEPAASLIPEQVEAIRLLVASSVPGLLAEQVNVLDQHGALPALQSSSLSPQIETPETGSSAAAMPNSPVKTLTAVIPKTPQLVSPVQSTSIWMKWERMAQNREVLLGLLLAVFVAWLLLRLRARGQRAALKLEANAEMQGEQSLDVRLVQLRQRVIADPRLAASVVKLWVQEK